MTKTKNTPVGQLRVLIADNDRDTCFLVQGSLGNDPVIACTMCMNVEQVQNFPPETRFDLCIVDVRFADSRYQLSHLLDVVRAKWPKAIVCVLSNYLGDIGALDRKRVNAMVQKPLFLLDASVLRSKLIECVLASNWVELPLWQRFLQILRRRNEDDTAGARPRDTDVHHASHFDVFLSHNSHDKAVVRQLKQRLATKKLSAWFDEDELRPGIPWQQLLEDGIKSSSSVAVLVGKDGIGPWEDEEMQGALRLAVKNKRPVIPVLLPGAPSQPDLPMFLGNRTWVDLRAGFTNEAIRRLLWGITGNKP